MRKLFGGLNLTWPKIIIGAVIAGVYTGIMAMLPAAKDTSFADISISFEVWILFGILIITNSKTPKESALKCFVFFLISQPIVYLLQVPFNVYGWGIFRYYPPWFAWTVFTLVMGYVGWYMRKEKWWALLILGAMLLLLAYHYYGFLREAISFFPNHLLSAVFCAVTMLAYPLCIFRNKKLRVAGVVISAVLLLAASALVFTQGRTAYNTTPLLSGGSSGVVFDDSYTVELADEAYGSVSIVYIDSIEDYAVNASFTKTGDTQLILRAPDGTEYVYALTIGRDTYDIKLLPDSASGQSGG